MEKTTYIKISRDFLKEIPPLKIKEEISILGMYNLVFEDMVKCYIEDANYGENEEKITLSEREIKRIANDMIYNDEILWEYINNSIDNYIGRALLERKGE